MEEKQCCRGGVGGRVEEGQKGAVQSHEGDILKFFN
jgi:hypothetical protein